MDECVLRPIGAETDEGFCRKTETSSSPESWRVDVRYELVSCELWVPLLLEQKVYFSEFQIKTTKNVCEVYFFLLPNAT